MYTIMDKNQLLDILKKNRDQHKAAFEEAMEGYRKAAIAELDQALADARAGKKIWRSTTLRQPTDQTGDYNRAIAMLEYTQEPAVKLDESQFNQLVLNKWHWAQQFAASNKMYVTSPVNSAYLDSLESQE